MKTVFLFVCGIRTWPGAEKNFTGKGVTWVHQRADRLQNCLGSSVVVAEKVEYRTWALTRWFRHQMRVRKFARTLERYAGWDIRIMAHSNGANVVLDGLKSLNWPNIRTLDLVSPACESNLGYVSPYLGDRIKRLRVWIGGKDLPLRLADTLPGWFLGYGALGRRGPTGIGGLTKKLCIGTIHRKDFGHSTWFKDEHFDDTMRRVTSLPE